MNGLMMIYNSHIPEKFSYCPFFWPYFKDEKPKVICLLNDIICKHYSGDIQKKFLGMLLKKVKPGDTDNLSTR